MAKILKLPQLVQQHRMPEMKVGRCRVESRLYPQRFPRWSFCTNSSSTRISWAPRLMIWSASAIETMRHLSQNASGTRYKKSTQGVKSSHRGISCQWHGLVCTLTVTVEVSAERDGSVEQRTFHAHEIHKKNPQAWSLVDTTEPNQVCIQAPPLARARTGLIITGLFLGATPDSAEATRTKTSALPATVEPGAAPITLPLELPESHIETSTAQPVQETADDAQWHTLTVKRGDTLTDLFARVGINSRELYNVLSLGDETRTLTKLLPGETLKLKRDSDGHLQELLYEINVTNALHVQRNGRASRHARFYAR